MIPPRIRITGNEVEGKKLLRFAGEQLRLLNSRMALGAYQGEGQNLFQDVRRIYSAAGWSVAVTQKGVLSDILIQCPYGVSVSEENVIPSYYVCWCCCCFAEAEITAVYGVYGCVGSCATPIPYPVCLNQTDLQVQEYTGIRYKVRVCQKDCWKEFIALASDMAEYHVGDKVAVFFRGKWGGEYVPTFQHSDCVMGLPCFESSCHATYPPRPTSGPELSNWKKPDGVFLIVPLQIDPVNAIIREAGIDFRTLDMPKDVAEDARVFYGRLISIDRTANTATVEIYHYALGTTEVLGNVPFHYNCECGEKFGLGHLAFIEWQYDTDPQTKTSWCIVLKEGESYKIIGFKDGLPRRCYSCASDKSIWIDGQALHTGDGKIPLELKGGKRPYYWEAYTNVGHDEPYSFETPDSEGKTNVLTTNIKNFSSPPHSAEIWVTDACLETIKCYVRIGCPSSAVGIVFKESYYTIVGGVWVDVYEATDQRAYVWSIVGATFDDGSFAGTGSDLQSSRAAVRRPSCGQYVLTMACVDDEKHTMDTFTSELFVAKGVYIVYSATSQPLNSSQDLASSDNKIYRWRITGGGAFDSGLTVKVMDSSGVKVYSAATNANCANNSTVKLYCVMPDASEVLLDSVNITFYSTSDLITQAYHATTCVPGNCYKDGEAAMKTFYSCTARANPPPNYDCEWNTGYPVFQRFNCAGTRLGSWGMTNCDHYFMLCNFPDAGCTGAGTGCAGWTDCRAWYQSGVNAAVSSCGPDVVDDRSAGMKANGCCPARLWGM